MKRKRNLLLVTILPVMVLAAFMSRQSGGQDFEAAREMIVLRKIAHELLRSAGDSSSRLPSIQRISDTEFRIPFEQRFSFEPDSLVQTIHQVMKKNELGDRYIVNVLEPSSGNIVFGYAMLGDGRDNIIPCQGREQQVKNYTVLIKLAERPFWLSPWILFGLGGTLLVLGIYFLMNSRNRKRGHRAATENTPQPSELNMEDGIRIGLYRFVPEERVLFFEREKTELTAKESRLLEIFVDRINQVIDRKQLQKEVWEDEGVIVGRSLDMFISRIRKKLEKDPSLKLVNIHGKGYKLEVQEPGLIV